MTGRGGGSRRSGWPLDFLNPTVVDEQTGAEPEQRAARVPWCAAGVWGEVKARRWFVGAVWGVVARERRCGGGGGRAMDLEKEMFEKHRDEAMGVDPAEYLTPHFALHAYVTEGRELVTHAKARWRTAAPGVPGLRVAGRKYREGEVGEVGGVVAWAAICGAVCEVSGVALDGCRRGCGEGAFLDGGAGGGVVVRVGR